MGEFDNRTAVVTGAAGGMGYKTAAMLVAGGAHVTMIDVKDQPALRTSLRLRIAALPSRLASVATATSERTDAEIFDVLEELRGRDDVLATAYIKDQGTLVALAGLAVYPVTVRLAIDWDALGIDPASASITAPAVEGLQESRTFGVDEGIPVEPGKGWLLMIGSRE